jgi:hypothetical protein
LCLNVQGSSHGCRDAGEGLPERLPWPLSARLIKAGLAISVTVTEGRVKCSQTSERVRSSGGGPMGMDPCAQTFWRLHKKHGASGMWAIFGPNHNRKVIPSKERRSSTATALWTAGEGTEVPHIRGSPHSHHA